MKQKRQEDQRCKSMKKCSKSGPKMVQKLVKNHEEKQMTCAFTLFLNRFSIDLGAHFGTKLVHLGAKLAIKAPFGTLFGGLGRHLGSKVLPRRPPEPPRPPQTSIFIDLGTIFGRIWVKFSMIF